MARKPSLDILRTARTKLADALMQGDVVLAQGIRTQFAQTYADPLGLSDEQYLQVLINAYNKSHVPVFELLLHRKHPKSFFYYANGRYHCLLEQIVPFIYEGSNFLQQPKNDKHRIVAHLLQESAHVGIIFKTLRLLDLPLCCEDTSPKTLLQHAYEAGNTLVAGQLLALGAQAHYSFTPTFYSKHLPSVVKNTSLGNAWFLDYLTHMRERSQMRSLSQSQPPQDAKKISEIFFAPPKEAFSSFSSAQDMHYPPALHALKMGPSVFHWHRAQAAQIDQVLTEQYQKHLDLQKIPLTDHAEYLKQQEQVHPYLIHTGNEVQSASWRWYFWTLECVKQKKPLGGTPFGAFPTLELERVEQAQEALVPVSMTPRTPFWNTPTRPTSYALQQSTPNDHFWDALWESQQFSPQENPWTPARLSYLKDLCGNKVCTSPPGFLLIFSLLASALEGSTHAPLWVNGHAVHTERFSFQKSLFQKHKNTSGTLRFPPEADALTLGAIALAMSAHNMVTQDVLQGAIDSVDAILQSPLTSAQKIAIFLEPQCLQWEHFPPATLSLLQLLLDHSQRFGTTQALEPLFSFLENHTLQATPWTKSTPEHTHPWTMEHGWSYAAMHQWSQMAPHFFSTQGVDWAQSPCEHFFTPLLQGSMSHSQMSALVSVATWLSAQPHQASCLPVTSEHLEALNTLTLHPKSPWKPQHVKFLQHTLERHFLGAATAQHPVFSSVPREAKRL